MKGEWYTLGDAVPMSRKLSAEQSQKLENAKKRAIAHNAWKKREQAKRRSAGARRGWETRRRNAEKV